MPEFCIKTESEIKKPTAYSSTDQQHSEKILRSGNVLKPELSASSESLERDSGGY